MPTPLVAHDVDLSRLDGFMLDTVKLLGSELVALSTGDEFKAAVLLWCRAWKQLPACSLPDDDRILASFAGNLAPAKWKKLKPMALRGFVKCDDGRLYHKVLALDAARADKAQKQRQGAIRARWGKDRGDGTPEAPPTPPEPAKPDTGGDTEPIRPYPARTYETNTPSRETVARDGTGRDVKEVSSSGFPMPAGAIPWTADGPSGASPLWAHALWSFHKIREIRHGVAPPAFLNARDLSIVRGWIEAGADCDALLDMFDERQKLGAKLGKQPYGLGYFMQAAAELAGKAA